ncbi:MAG: PEP-CTERM sorting domain-containing protein [Acidobacteriota bacterium]|nr:PEP-CTERM sorting domain-containing protein [Acidobacteriota bacterium]
MSIVRSILGVLVTAIAACSMAANAATLNFSSLSQAGSSYAAEGSSYTQQGFTFTSGTFAVWQASSANLPGLDTANTSLFQFFAGGVTSMTAGGNGAFTLSSIELAPLVAGGAGTFGVTFVGTKADASTVSQTFTVSYSGTPTLQTFAFPNFTNVVNVSFTQGTNIGFFVAQSTAYQFNNVVVTPSATTPEPGSLPLLAIGAVCLIGLGSKRANASRE